VVDLHPSNAQLPSLADSRRPKRANLCRTRRTDNVKRSEDRHGRYGSETLADLSPPSDAAEGERGPAPHRQPAPAAADFLKALLVLLYTTGEAWDRTGSYKSPIDGMDDAGNTVGKRPATRIGEAGKSLLAAEAVATVHYPVGTEAAEHKPLTDHAVAPATSAIRYEP
jgi:hypothetical protein